MGNKTLKSFTIDQEIYEKAREMTENLSGLVNELLRDYVNYQNEGTFDPNRVKSEMEEKKKEYEKLKTKIDNFEEEIAKQAEREREIEEENRKKAEEMRARNLENQKKNLKGYRPDLDIEALSELEVKQMLGDEIIKERKRNEKAEARKPK